MVRFAFAAFTAFLMFFRAAAFCLLDAMVASIQCMECLRRIARRMRGSAAGRSILAP